MFARFGVEMALLNAAWVCRVTDIEARGTWGFQCEGALDLGGIVLPYVDPRSAHRVTSRLRRDHPETDADGKPRNKYLCARGDNRHLYFPPGAGTLLDDVAAPLVFVESEKSALAITALASKSGRRFLALATGGCWGWRGKTGIETGPNGEREETRGPLPDFDLLKWGGRRAIIIFDSNSSSNPKVAAARSALVAELTRRGARVYVVNLPKEPEVNGPDDFIAVRSGEAMLQLIDDAQESRPSVVVRAGEQPLAVDRAEEILCARFENLKIFQRAGEIVRVIALPVSKRGSGLHREAGAIQLISVSAVALTELLDRLIEWQKLKAIKGGFEPGPNDCPSKIAASYLSRIGSWRLPRLAGIISAPIMRADGTVLCRAGYDTATELLLTEDWPHLDGNPSRTDALDALDRIQEPFAEFPFVAAEDRTVLAAGFLTAVQRRLLETAPLFGFSAPTPRTGKSLLAESLAIVATGRPAPAMAVSGEREEMRKAVLASLREGHSVINLDNVEHPLASPDLARAITQTEYADRLLGESRILRFSTNLLWTVTGNNLAFRGDLAVRALISRLDAGLERPEERKFKIADLKTYVVEHRGDLVTAALTILRAYVVAGRPHQALMPWGGFDEWSAAIRAPLVWLGAADPCGARQHVIEDDPDREQAAALLSAWYSAVGDKPIRTAELLERVPSTPDLASALRAVAPAKNDASQVDPRRVAWWCRQWRGRIVGGKRLEQGSNYGDRATWKVSAVSTVSAVINPSTNAQEAGGGSVDDFYRRENDRTDRNDRNDRNGRQNGRGADTLFDTGSALEI
jgi:hypothetical protein